jgi:DNA polymerase-3 subunit epsilon
MSSLARKTLAIVDVETTGSSPVRDRIIEIGILRVEDGEVVRTYRSLINPGRPLPSSIRMITGITDDDLATAPSFEDAASDIHDMLAGAVFVAHNARFDYGFVKNELRRAGTNFTAKCLCTVRLSRVLFKGKIHHDLDSVIERHGLVCENRHRAFDDAQVLWDFLLDLLTGPHADRLDGVIETLLKEASLPPLLDSRSVAALPEGPGVYAFYGVDGDVLYVGKSKSLRDRVLSHFASDHATAKEMRLCQQVATVETFETAGELGALLLESEMVKSLSPAYNRQLIKRTELVVARRKLEGAYYTVRLERVSSIDRDGYDGVLAVFRTLSQAKQFLREASKEHRLCHRLLALEKTNASCFQKALGRCNGACIGAEHPDAYNERFEEAFERRRIKAWPFKDPIIVRECSDDETSHSFILDNWCLLASINATADDTSVTTYGPAFDYDGYKIMARFLSDSNNRKYWKPISRHELASLMESEADEVPTVRYD